VVILAIGFAIQVLNKNKSTNLEGNDSVTLRDFPVSNWDSENDAQEIVDWYNRKSGEDKTVSDFMELCEVTKFDSRNDAQKLLDAAMLFLETIKFSRNFDFDFETVFTWCKRQQRNYHMRY
jgi:hypothetical protein